MNNRIFLVAAHPLEFKEIRKRLKMKRLPVGVSARSVFKEIPIELGLTGVGEQAVRQNLPLIFSKRQNLPRCVLNFGLAGALNSQIKLRDWILVDEVKSFRSNSKPIRLGSTPFFKSASEFFSGSAYPFHRGPLITAEEPVTNSGHKNLFRKTRALAVDMEAYPLLETASEFNVPVLCLKIISDYADQNGEKTLKRIRHKLVSDIADLVFDLLTFLETKTV